MGSSGAGISWLHWYKCTSIAKEGGNEGDHVQTALKYYRFFSLLCSFERKSYPRKKLPLSPCTNIISFQVNNITITSSLLVVPPFHYDTTLQQSTWLSKTRMNFLMSISFQAVNKNLGPVAPNLLCFWFCGVQNMSIHFLLL